LELKKGGGLWEHASKPGLHGIVTRTHPRHHVFSEGGGAGEFRTRIDGDIQIFGDMVKTPT
jgi:hypothetical protein